MIANIKLSVKYGYFRNVRMISFYDGLSLNIDDVLPITEPDGKAAIDAYFLGFLARHCVQASALARASAYILTATLEDGNECGYTLNYLPLEGACRMDEDDNDNTTDWLFTAWYKNPALKGHKQIYNTNMLKCVAASVSS